jgi:hypothetical protein
MNILAQKTGGLQMGPEKNAHFLESGFKVLITFLRFMDTISRNKTAKRHI